MNNVIPIDFATRERREFIQQQPTPETLRERFAQATTPRVVKLTERARRAFPWTDPDRPGAA